MNNIYVADFETTTDPNDTRVWLWGLYNINNDKFDYGKDLDSFFKRIMKLPNSTKVYFHNLKFDGEFFQYALFKRGFTHTTVRKICDKEFHTLISHMGHFYSMKFKDRGKTITLIDSLKIIPLTVKKIAKAFNTPMLKGEIDYHKFRPTGYEPSSKEVEYVKNDVAIVANALKFFFNVKLTKQTIASNALFDYKNRIGVKNFKMWFPVLEQDVDLRQSYKGGFTYVNPIHKNKELGNGIVLDVNSLYPSVMYDKKLPYGEPIYYEGEYQPDKVYNLYIQTFRCNFELREGKIPSIQIKNSLIFKDTEYLTSSDGYDVTLCLTSVDLELFHKQYKVYNMEYFGGWKFKSSTQLFKEYINHWMSVKEKATKEENEGMRTLAKLMLNSLYGKFGLNPVVKNKIPTFDAEENFIRYCTGGEERRDTIYVPMASFITSYARAETITSAQANYERFIYADTDSLHLLGQEVPSNLKIDKVKMGYWELEARFIKSKFIRAKTYVEEHFITDEEYNKLDHSKKYKEVYDVATKTSIEVPLWEYNHEHDVYTQVHFTVAGAPDRVKDKMTFNTFIVGKSFEGKLENKRVSGGVVLVDKPFTLKPS